MICRNDHIFPLIGCTIALSLTLNISRLDAKQDVRQDSLLAVVESLYKSGSYLSAELEARRFLEQPIEHDSLHIQAEKYLAFSLVAQGKTQSAIQHFRIVLELDSTFDLDPLLTSPKILAAFNETRAAFFSKRRMEEEHFTQTVKSPLAPISFRTIVFPGWEQIYRGRTATGYSFVGAGIAALGTTVFCDIRRRDLHTAYLDASNSIEAAKRYDRYNQYYKAEIYSAVAFAAVYLLSEIDVFVNHASDVSLSVHGGRSAEITVAVSF